MNASALHHAESDVRHMFSVYSAMADGYDLPEHDESIEVPNRFDMLLEHLMVVTEDEVRGSDFAKMFSVSPASVDAIMGRLSHSIEILSALMMMRGSSEGECVA